MGGKVRIFVMNHFFCIFPVINRLLHRHNYRMTSEEFKIEVLPLKNKLFRFARRFMGKIEESEDVVQDVFIKLWSDKEKIKEYRSLEAFAMVITKNLCLDKLKAKKNRVIIQGSHDDATEETPYTTTEMTDTMQHVHRLIAALPEQQRMIIHLRDIEGMDFEEIAGVLNMEMNAIRVSLSRARRKVRDELIKIQHYEYSGN